MTLSDRSMSPFIAPYATGFCHRLAQYGGCITTTTGLMHAGVSYVRREGMKLARLVHVEDVETREPFMFVLNEVTGGYTNGSLELWPFAPPTCTLLPDVHRHLCLPVLVKLVEDFLSDVMPSNRPHYADPRLLRRQLLWTSENPKTWQSYWRSADSRAGSTPDTSLVTKRSRMRQNIWPSRKRSCHENNVS